LRQCYYHNVTTFIYLIIYLLNVYTNDKGINNNTTDLPNTYAMYSK